MTDVLMAFFNVLVWLLILVICVPVVLWLYAYVVTNAILTSINNTLMKRKIKENQNGKERT